MKFVGALFAIMLAILGASYYVYRHGAALECEDRLLEETASPDGAAIAARYERVCGGKSASTHVGLRQRGAPFAPPDPLGEVYVASSRAYVKLQWESPRALLVDAPEVSAIPDRPQWKNVRVKVRVVR